MNPQIKTALKDLIIRFKDTNPEFNPCTIDVYLNRTIDALLNVDESVILETMAVCYEKRFWESKGVMYIKGIALGKQKEFLKRKEIEEKEHTPIPGKTVW